MTLTKEQWIELSNLFHKHFDFMATTDTDINAFGNAASFPAIVKIVEDFLTKRPLDWQPGAPSLSGRYFLITKMVPFPHDYYPYDPDDAEWDTDEVLFHFGPIPPAPKIDRT